MPPLPALPTTRRGFLRAAGLAGGALLLPRARGAPDATPSSMPTPPDRRPSIVVLISDDTSPRYFGHAAEPYLTPQLDALAAGGCRFTQARVVAPVCTPSRYAYLTGQYPSRCRDPRFLEEFPGDAPCNLAWNTHLVPGQFNLGLLMREAGYATGYCGKMHCGGGHAEVWGEEIPRTGSVYDPAFDAALRRIQGRCAERLRTLGWDEAHSVVWGNVDQFDAPESLRQHNLEWTTHGARAFLENRRDDPRPFCLYVGVHAVHGPRHAENIEDLDPRVSYGGLLPEGLDTGHPPRATLAARLRAAGLPVNHRTVGMLWIDDCLGAIRAKLRDIGREDDTILVYKADHGVRSKNAVYLEGARVPLIWHGPGRVAAGSRCHTPVQNIDFLPTVAEVCGVPMPRGAVVDGASYAGCLAGTAPFARDTLYNEMGMTRSIERGRFHHIAFRHTPGALARMREGAVPVALTHPLHAAVQLAALHHPAYFDPDQLYDTEQDPEEQHNLAGDPRYADVLADLRRRLADAVASTGRTFPAEADAFTRTAAYAELVAAYRRTRTITDVGYFHERFW